MTRFDAENPPASAPRIDPLAVDAPHLLEWIDRRTPMSIARFDSIGEAEYARAFTSAGTLGNDVAATLYKEFRANIAGLRGEDAFKRRVIPIMREKGWLPDLDDAALGRRVALIFDTNLRLARSAGKWARIQETKDYLPYIQYRTVGDGRVRDSHRALDRIMLPVDHWFWERHFPPCDFNCRCQAVAMSRSQAARIGPLTSENEVRSAVALAGSTWPNAGMGDRSREVIDRANERAIPGAMPANANALAERGSSVWRGLFGSVAERLTERLMETLRGP